MVDASTVMQTKIKQLTEKITELEVQLSYTVKYREISGQELLANPHLSDRLLADGWIHVGHVDNRDAEFWIREPIGIHIVKDRPKLQPTPAQDQEDGEHLNKEQSPLLSDTNARKAKKRKKKAR